MQPGNNIQTLRCPLTLDIMVDPVIAADGITYDRAAIANWLRDNNTSPITRQEISSTLITNYFAKSIIDEHIRQQIVNSERNRSSSLSHSSDTESSQENNQQQSEPTDTYSYLKLLQKLETILSVSKREVEYGSAVQQTLVAMSSVFSNQEGTIFRAEGHAGVKFTLNFVSNVEYQRFALFYRTKFPGSIIREQATVNKERKTETVFDSKILYERIVPALGAFKKEYSLWSIMQNLATLLKVEFKEVDLGGDAFERRLVGKAGITTSQKDAVFCRLPNFCLQSNLAFKNEEEYNQFVNFYNQNYANFIIVAHPYNRNGFSTFDLNSIKLINDIAPTLTSDLDPSPNQQQELVARSYYTGLGCIIS